VALGARSHRLRRRAPDRGRDHLDAVAVGKGFIALTEFSTLSKELVRKGPVSLREYRGMRQLIQSQCGFRIS
jgi:hypothetical protein